MNPRLQTCNRFEALHGHEFCRFKDACHTFRLVSDLQKYYGYTLFVCFTNTSLPKDKYGL